MSEYLYVAKYVDRFGGVCPNHKKIGIGENVPARMRSLSDTKGTIYVITLAVWKSANGKTVQKVELMLHRHFEERRLNGEWFSDKEETLLEEVELVIEEYGYVERVDLSDISMTLPPKIGATTGHHDYVSNPKGRRRESNKEEIIGMLHGAYNYLVSILPEDYVALNDNGPYIRANKNGTAFWIEPRARGIKLNFWAGGKAPLYEKMQVLLNEEFDGKSATKVGTGMHEGQHQFSIHNMSISDLGKIVAML